MAKQVDVILKLNDQFSGGLKSGMGGAIKVATAAAAAFAGVALAATAIGFSMASTMENIEQQFTPLLNGADNAKARLKELSTFAANTPFALKEVASASKTLETLTKGVLSTGDGLTLVGDAAAVAGVGFEELSVHVGRAYSNLNSNRAAGESISRMQELGLISGETRNKIEGLQKAGKGKEAWTVLQTELKKTSGAMDGLANTFDGRLSTLKDNVGLTMADMVTQFGLFDVAKDLMKGLTDRIAEFGENTDFTAIGMQVVDFANNMINSIKAVIPNIAGVMTVFQTLGTILFNLGQIIVDSVISNLKNMGLAIKTVIEAVVDLASGEFTSAKDGMVKGFTEIGKNSLENAGKAIENFKDMGTAVGNFKENYTNNIKLATEGTDLLTKGVKTLSTAIEANADKEITTTTKDKGKDKGKDSGPSDTEIKNAQKVNDALMAARLQHKEFSMSEDAIEIARINAKYEGFIELAGNNASLIKDIETANQIEITDVKQTQTEARMKLDKEATDYAIAQAERERDAKLNATAGFFGGFAKLAGVAAKKDKAARIVSKGLAIAEAGVNTGLAATKALSAAPPPYNFALMAGVLAAGGAQIANIASQKFANGGIVQGTSTSGDKTAIRVNAKEAVLTTGDQRELLDIVHGKKSVGNQSSASNTPVVNHITISGNIGVDERKIAQLVRNGTDKLTQTGQPNRMM